MPEHQPSDHAHATPPRRMVVARPMTVIGVLLLALVCGVLIGSYASSTFVDDATRDFQQTREELSALQTAYDRLEERNWMLYGRLQSLESPTTSATPSPAEETSGDPSPVGRYTDGTYLVGTEIEAGTYAGTVVGNRGYWARLNATTGMISAIIANDTPRKDFVLTINPSDAAVELRGVVLTGPE